MRNGDRIVLDALRDASADWMTPAEWDAIDQIVEQVGGVNKTTGYARTVIDKAAQRFGSRSEAGRYAATVRWGSRGASGGGQADAGSPSLEARTTALADKSVAAATQHAVGLDPSFDEAAAMAGKEETWENYYRVNRENRGWGGPAQSATAEEADALVESGQFVVTYRGGRTTSHEKYLTDDANIGKGAMGNGMYTSPTYDRAAFYSTEGNSSGVSNPLLPPTTALKDVRAYLVPVAGLQNGRLDSSDTWQRGAGLHAVRHAMNASYGQNQRASGTDDLLIHNIGMLIQAPKGWRPKTEQTFDATHPISVARQRAGLIDD